MRKINMLPAPKLICLLILITISTFLFMNSEFMAASWAADESRNALQVSSKRRAVQVEETSGEDNAGGDLGTRLLTRFRLLLGMKIPSGRPKHERTEYFRAPAPAPVPSRAIGSETPATITKFKAHVLPAFPMHRRHHIAPVQSLAYGSGTGTKEMHRRIVLVAAAAATVGAALIIVLGVVVALLCKRSRRSRSKKMSERLMLLASRRPIFQAPSAATNKVSFDPGSDQFYLDSFAKYLESDYGLYQTSQLKNVSSVESMSNFLSNNGDPLKCESDNVSCLDEEKIPEEEEPLSSDDESFHSVASHPLNLTVISSSEEYLSHASENCSLISSYRSTSPGHVVPSLSCASPNHQEANPSAKTFVIPQKVSAPTHSFLYSSSQSSRGSRFQVPDRHHIEDNVPLCCNEALALGYVDSGKFQSLQSTELSSTKTSSADKLKCSACTAETPSATSKTTAEERIPSPMAIVSSGHTPKPPPPPPPPPPHVRPPSFFKGCNSGHPPPPPPCSIHLVTPIGTDGTPLPKLKPLHWDKVRAAPDRSMVWDKIRSSSFEFDEKMIESLFGYNLRSSAKIEEAKSKTPSPSKHVMEHKRLQNTTILMKALNASAEQVCNALMLGEGLTAQQLEALVKMAPTKEEEEKLSNFDGNIDELDPAEKLIKEVLCISFAFSRSEVMLYKETFDDEVTHLRNSFAIIEEACKELRSSRLFLRLLEAVLKTGNRMNVGTIRGGARAFKLDALLKLADVKGTDGKTTLLHFVVQEIVRLEGVNEMEMGTRETAEKHKPGEKGEDYKAMSLKLVSGLSTELCNVKKTATIDLDVLVSSVANLSTGLCQLRKLVEEDLIIDERSQRFVHSTRSFLTAAEKTVEELKDNENQVLLQVRNITEYYHGNVSKDEVNPLLIFVIVRNFLCLLDRVCKEVGKSKTHQQLPIQLLPLDKRGHVSSS